MTWSEESRGEKKQRPEELPSLWLTTNLCCFLYYISQKTWKSSIWKKGLTWGKVQRICQGNGSSTSELRPRPRSWTLGPCASQRRRAAATAARCYCACHKDGSRSHSTARKGKHNCQLPLCSQKTLHILGFVLVPVQLIFAGSKRNKSIPTSGSAKSVGMTIFFSSGAGCECMAPSVWRLWVSRCVSHLSYICCMSCTTGTSTNLFYQYIKLANQLLLQLCVCADISSVLT